MKDWYLMYKSSGESYAKLKFVGRSTKEEVAKEFLRAIKQEEPYSYGRVTKITDKGEEGYYL